MKNTYTYEYPRASLTADIVIFSEDRTEVVLIQRKNEPYKGHWAFPGGFMDMGETLEQCAVRELEEETSIKMDSLRQLGAFSDIDRDPRGRTITVAYYGIADKAHCPIKAQDDAAAVGWFRINELPPLAFDHAKILAEAIKAVKNL